MYSGIHTSDQNTHYVLLLACTQACQTSADPRISAVFEIIILGHSCDSSRSEEKIFFHIGGGGGVPGNLKNNSLREDIVLLFEKKRTFIPYL